MLDDLKPKQRRRRYSPEEKAAGLVLLRKNSGLDAPLAATANQLGISMSTLFDWQKGRGISDKIRELAEQECKTLADIYRETAVLGALRLRESLADDERCAKTPLKDIATAAGVATQQAQLLSGAPTQITRTEDTAALAALRQKAEELIAALLPDCGGDRDAAIARAREMAPTLSNWIN